MHNKPRFKILSWKSRRTTSCPFFFFFFQTSPDHSGLLKQITIPTTPPRLPCFSAAKFLSTTSGLYTNVLWGPCLYFSLYVGMYINHTKNASQFTQRRCYVQLQCHVPTYNSAAICTYPSTLSIAVKIKPAVFRIALFMYIHGALS
jgi:hypothetical protein